jgi:hypothetical protein
MEEVTSTGDRLLGQTIQTTMTPLPPQTVAKELLKSITTELVMTLSLLSMLVVTMLLTSGWTQTTTGYL